MALDLPLPLTMWAQISCTDFRKLDAASRARLPADWFDIPESYEQRVTSVNEYLQGGGGLW